MAEMVQHVLTAALVGAALALLFPLIERSRHRTNADPEVMAYPRVYLWMGLVCAAFFIGLALMSHVFFVNETSTPWVLALFLTFAAMGLWLIWEALLVRHRIGRDGIVHRSPLFGTHLVRWDDVREVRYSPSMKWWVIRARGRTVRVSAGMAGQVRFAQAVLDRVARNAIDDETFAVLEDSADGFPPPLMS